MWGKLSVEEFFMGEEDFHRGMQHFLALFKKNEKINMQKFFQLKVRSSIKN